MRDIIIHLVILLVLPPLLLGAITKTKAFFAGRSGPPLLQTYHDIYRLLRKGAVYSTATTWVFRAGPIVSLATVMIAGLLVPFGGNRATFVFAGDMIVFAYLLGLGRFFTMAAALDTGSSFEGMGASREAAFASLAEPALFLVLAVLAVLAHSVSLQEAFGVLATGTWGQMAPVLVVACIGLAVVLLAENSRIPVDDPATHLELTMLHEVMVLDHSGPDLAFIVYGSTMKLFLFGALLLQLVLPAPVLLGAQGVGLFCVGELVVAVLVGACESIIARLRLQRVPQFLVAAAVLGGLGVTILFAGGLR